MTGRNMHRRAVCLCAVLHVALLACGTSIARAQPPTPARKVFANSVTPLPLHRGLIVAASDVGHRQDAMLLLFSLPIPAEARARLAARVAQGEVVAPRELERDYGGN